MAFHLDEGLRPFATEAQWRHLTALAEYGSERKAAAALGITKRMFSTTKSAVLAKAARQGYAPDADLNHRVPDGYMLRGTTTLYKDGEQVLQWVKTKEDQARQWELFKEAIEAFTDDLPRLKPAAAPRLASTDLMAAYNISDHHIGMLAWGEETGADYDIGIAEQLLMGAMSHLVSIAPACEHCLIAFHGDLLHYDSYEAVTPTSRHLLDSDSRYPKMARTSIRVTRAVISFALKRHQKVRVIIAPGNHDPSSSVFLRECIAALYENEPRVSVDTSPTHFHYFEFGKNLIGVHHGDLVKAPNLPLVMASDRAEAWGRTAHRYWWTGHVHHDSRKDYAGCNVESFRVLPPADAHAIKTGYRSERDMKAIILHKDHGEVARHIVNPGMLS